MCSKHWCKHWVINNLFTPFHGRFMLCASETSLLVYACHYWYLCSIRCYCSWFLVDYQGNHLLFRCNGLSRANYWQLKGFIATVISLILHNLYWWCIYCDVIMSIWLKLLFNTFSLYWSYNIMIAVDISVTATALLLRQSWMLLQLWLQSQP